VHERFPQDKEVIQIGMRLEQCQAEVKALKEDLSVNIREREEMKKAIQEVREAAEEMQKNTRDKHFQVSQFASTISHSHPHYIDCDRVKSATEDSQKGEGGDEGGGGDAEKAFGEGQGGQDRYAQV